MSELSGSSHQEIFLLNRLNLLNYNICMYVCMCVYICIYICVCVYVCVYIYIYCKLWQSPREFISVGVHLNKAAGFRTVVFTENKLLRGYFRIFVEMFRITYCAEHLWMAGPVCLYLQEVCSQLLNCLRIIFIR